MAEIKNCDKQFERDGVFHGEKLRRQQKIGSSGKALLRPKQGRGRIRLKSFYCCSLRQHGGGGGGGGGERM